MNGEEIATRDHCPNCKSNGKGTNKNLAIYSEGAYCHACGYTKSNTKSEKKESLPLINQGDYFDMSDRLITKDTCEKYGVKVYEHDSYGLVRIFPLYKNGKLIKQKLKSIINKRMQILTGDTKANSLFGQNVFSPTKNLPIIITEGEEDAMAAFQMSKLPSVSITRGANGSENEILDSFNSEWLSGWKEILLCIDNDDAGKKCLEELTALFDPGTVRNVVLPLKDANEMLKANKQDEFRKAIVTAERIKPSTVVFLDDPELLEKILTKPKYGTPWPWECMTKVTYGNRKGEVYMLAGDSSIGKTQIVYQIISNHIGEGEKVCLIDLERQNEQTIHRVISGIIHKKIYLPSCEDFDVEEIREVVDKLKDKIMLYRPSSGKLTLDSILINIRYLTKANNVLFFVLDNLTALSTNLTHGTKEHEFAAHATGKLVNIAKELNITIFIINHLSKSQIQLNADITMPDDHYKYVANRAGLTWESGRMPEMTNIYGGGKVCKLPDFVIVAARNRMSTNDKEKRTILIKFLKTRFESDYEGHIFKLVYDRDTGLLLEEPNYEKSIEEYQNG